MVPDLFIYGVGIISITILFFIMRQLKWIGNHRFGELIDINKKQTIWTVKQLEKIAERPQINLDELKRAVLKDDPSPHQEKIDKIKEILGD